MDDPSLEDLLDMFSEAKDEIIKLLNINFYTKFSKNIFDERRKEEWLRMSESGWRFTGLEPFLALEEHFEYSADQHERLVKFLNLRMGHLKQMKNIMSKGRRYHQLVVEFLADDVIQLRLPKITWLLMKLYNLPEIRMKALQKYIDQLTEIWKTLFNYAKTLTASYEAIRSECDEIVQKLLVFRDKIKVAHEQIQELKKPHIGSDGLAKVPKATYNKIKKLQEVKTTSFSSLCNAEEEFKPVMQLAVEKLQSLEFSRLENIRNVLTKVSFAEYNFTKDMILALKPIVSYVEENDLIDDAREYALYNIFQGGYEFDPSDILEGSIVFDQKDFINLKSTLDSCKETLRLFYLSQPILLETIMEEYGQSVMNDVVSLSKDEEERQAKVYPVEANNVTLPSVEEALCRFYQQGTTLPDDILDGLNQTVMNSVEIVERSPASEQAVYMDAFEVFLDTVRIYHNEARPFENEAQEYRQMKREQANLMAEMRYADETTQISLISRFSEIEQDIKRYEQILLKAIEARQVAAQSKVSAIQKLMDGRVARMSNSLKRLFSYQLNALENMQAGTLSTSVEIDPIKDIELIASLKIYKQEDKYDMESAFRILSDTTDFNTTGRKKTGVLSKVSSFKFI
mmetsp:Transcript_1517/g.1948  ORF Transcript_1517/g.1948 Transcript_1517/m.1948 type:complete len:627 (-) Transcript_1517:826-2706(-)